MAMTRRSWFRVIGIIAVLGLVATVGGAILFAQTYPPGTLAPVSGNSNSCTIPATTPTLAEKSIKPIGIWERKVGPLCVTLRFDDEQLHGTITLRTKEADTKEAIVTFRADYSVTKDYIIYGVVSSIDAKLTGKKKVELEDISKMEDGLSALHEQPFSMRFRQDGHELILRDLKFNPQTGERSGDLNGKTMAIGLGRFTRKGEECTKTVNVRVRS